LNFETSIFDTYQTQIIDHINRFESLPSELKCALKIQGSKTPSERMQFHATYILKLREALQENQSDKNTLNELSKTLFTQTDLRNDYETVLAQYIDLSDKKIESKPLHRLIQDYYEELLNKVGPDNKTHQKPPVQDFLVQGFLPSYLYSTGKTKVVYTPLFIIENKKTGEKKFDEIFLSYLRALKKNNEKHLYISVRPVDKEFVELSDSPEFKNVFVFIGMDRGTDFYYQKKAYENQNQASLFKKDLLDNILNNKTNYYWPESILETNWKQKVEQRIGNLHEKYFANRSTLNKIERGVFIELINAELIDMAREIVQPNFMNMTCTYTMDRGPSQYAFNYLYERLKTKGFLSTEEKREFIIQFFVSSILVHNRTLHDYRVNRMVETLEYLNKLQK
jgi:hypothetical protein